MSSRHCAYIPSSVKSSLTLLLVTRSLRQIKTLTNFITNLRKDCILEKTLYLLLSGRVRKQFIDKTTRLIKDWLHDSPMKNTASKVIMIMPRLLIQKPSQKLKPRQHLEALEQHMNFWTSGEILELLREGEAFRKDLRLSSTPLTFTKISKKNTRETYKVNVINATELLTDNKQNRSFH